LFNLPVILAANKFIQINSKNISRRFKATYWQ